MVNKGKYEDQPGLGRAYDWQNANRANKHGTNIFTGRVKIKGTMIVRDKDGNIKYDDPSLKGTYGEDKSTFEEQE